ncbi:MAG: 50S ribosomal protein L4 [Candidatus Muiribacteriota bacterium]
MAKMSLIDMKGKEVEKLDVNDNIFNVKVNENLVHESILNQLANKRQGTHSTKTRSMVKGSGQKPFRQKGTGRARQGTNKSPLKPGGGITFGPHPRDYRYKINRKQRKVALKSALSDKLINQKAVAVNFDLSEIKTKNFVEFFNNCKTTGLYNLIMISNKDGKDKIYLSARNIPKTKVLNVDSINVYDLVRYENVYFSREAVNKIEEVYKDAK